MCILRTILQLCRPGSETQLLLAYQPRAKEDQTFLKEEPHAAQLPEVLAFREAPFWDSPYPCD